MILRKQAGSALLLELSIVAIIAALGAAAKIWAEKEQLVETAFTAQGTMLKRLRNGADIYLTKNYDQLIADVPAIPGVANPYQPSIAELRAQNVIPPGFGDTGVFGQPYKVAIQRLPAGCSGLACTDLVGVVYLDGQITNRVGLGVALVEIGGDGAFSDASSPGTMTGIGGAPTIVNPKGNVAGIIGAAFGYNTGGFAQFLRLDGSKAMTGRLNLGSHDVINATGVLADATGATGTLNLGRNIKVGNPVGAANGSIATGTATVESNIAQALVVKGEARLSGIDVTGNGRFGGSIVANDYFNSYRKQWMSQIAPDIVIKGSQVVDLKATPNIAKPDCVKLGANQYGTPVDSTKPYSTDITTNVSGTNLSAGSARIYATPVAGIVGSFSAVKGSLTSVTNPDGSTTFTQTIDNTDGAAGLFDLTATDAGGYWQLTYNTRNYPQEAIALVQVACKY